MPTVQILPDEVSVQIKAGTSLLAAASAAGVELMHSCGGIGACTSCRVLIVSGREQLSPIGRAEREQLKESGILETHRLACQTMVYGNVVMERPLWRTSLDSPVTGD